MRKLLIGLLLLLLVFYFGAYVFSNQINTVFVNSNKIDLIQQPFINDQNKQIYIPLVLVSASLGGEVVCSKSNIFIKRGGVSLVLPMGIGNILINGQVCELDAPVLIKEGQPYVQLKLISDALGFFFSWRKDSNTLDITIPAAAGIVASRSVYADFHKQGMVTFSYDDGWIGQYNLAYPLHVKYNLPASFNAVASWVDKNGYITSTQLQELAKAGFEIASHSNTHPNSKNHYFKDITREEANNEIINSKNKLVGWGLPRVEGFVVPGSVHADWLAPLICGHYQYIRSNRGRNLPTDPVESAEFHLVQYSDSIDTADLPSFVVINSHTPEDIIKVVDQAIAEKKWLIIMMHNVGDNKNDVYTWDPSKLEQVLQYIAAKPKTELLPVTLRDGVRFASGLGDYRCQSITLTASADAVALGEKVLLTSKGYDENGVEVPTTAGYRPGWVILSGLGELIDNGDGTASLTITGESKAVVRCFDAGDAAVYANVEVSVK